MPTLLISPAMLLSAISVARQVLIGRYCPSCDLLIAHQDEVEALMAAMFAEHKPEVVGNDYLVLGTMDRAEWQRGRTSPLNIPQMVAVLHDFKDVVRFEPAGWGWGR